MERDFTEAPSQMLEEWVWDPTTLATFATHYQTGAPIPAALVQQMRRASEFGQGLDVRGQMLLARVRCRSTTAILARSTTRRCGRKSMRRYVDIPFMEGTNRQASFPHIGQAGYASAYYTYMWSLRHCEGHVRPLQRRQPDRARRRAALSRKVFEPGSPKPAGALVEDFLGRPFTPMAWEEWLNRETSAPGTN